MASSILVEHYVLTLLKPYVYNNLYKYMMEHYIKPSDVHAPKRFWSLVHVLFDGGAGDSSLAIGRWENRPVLAMRWNGDKDNPLGNPQSRGLPTWFIVPEQHWKQILETEQYSFSDDKITFARHFLELRRVYFLSPCPNPACPDRERLALHTFRPDALEKTLKEVERDEFRLYHIICDGSWIPRGQEKADLTAVLKGAWEHQRLHFEVKVTARLLENGMVDFSSSKIVDGRLLTGPNQTAPTTFKRDQLRDVLLRQLKATGCGASDEQIEAFYEELTQSRCAELWIPQNTSQFFTAPGPL
jgi:hypothetical protein